LNHQAKAAQINPQTEPETPFFQSPKSLKSFDDGQGQFSVETPGRLSVEINTRKTTECTISALALARGRQVPGAQ
jgi:hypothetical protein